MLLVYSHKITERVKYSFDLLLTNLLGIPVEFTSDKALFATSDSPKINYSTEPIADELFFYAAGLLHERGIKDHEIHVKPFEETIGFFGTNEKSAWPFDVFAASFYLVSRYEEYLPFLRDEHNRFPATESIAMKNGFLEDPVVNIWALKLKGLLKARFRGLKFVEYTYHFTPTYDIDIAWAYLHKGLIRSVGGFGKSLLKLNFKDFYLRATSMLGIGSDPYFTYDYIKSLQNQFAFNPIYFFLMGDFDKYDKSTSYTVTPFQSLIKEISDYAPIGIHPSYASNSNGSKVSIEKKRLDNILHRNITRSRQHYLMMTMPDTYQQLIDVDISEDYTMGYSSVMGFRAGICTPYRFYNIRLEYAAPLTIFPFAIMDASLKYYKKLPPGEAAEATHTIIDKVKKVNGNLITLWHNNSFCEQFEWKGWRKAYEEIVRYAVT